MKYLFRQVQNDLKKTVKQNEENNVKLNTRFYENLSDVKLSINDVHDKMNQKILDVSFEIIKK